MLKLIGTVVLGLFVIPLVAIPVIVALLRGVFNIILRAQKLVVDPKVSNDERTHVLVTGGSSGIGLEVAKIYILKGFNVSIMARDRKKLETARDDIIASAKPKIGDVAQRIKVVSCDVSKGEAEIKKALEESVAAFGPVTTLINSAGVTYISSFEDSDIKEFDRVMQINYLGSVYITRVVLPDMKENRRGNIVFVSSQVAQV